MSTTELVNILKMSHKLEPGSGVRAPLSGVIALDMSFSTVQPHSHWSHILLAISQLPLLNALYLNGTVVGSWCWGHLEHALKARHLRVLHLDECVQLHHISAGSTAAEVNEQARLLVQALTAQKQLEELSLRGSNLQPYAVSLLLEACIGMPQLHTLALSYSRHLSANYQLVSNEAAAAAHVEPPPAELGVPPTEEELVACWRDGRKRTVLITDADVDALKQVFESLVHFATFYDPVWPRADSFVLEVSRCTIRARPSRLP